MPPDTFRELRLLMWWLLAFVLLATGVDVYTGHLDPVFGMLNTIASGLFGAAMMRWKSG